jgi:hypothetical protein
MIGYWNDQLQLEQEDGGRLVLFRTNPADDGQQVTQLAIIGVLVALLLPAIQAAREAARRSQCNNNLRQIGIAALNYEAAKKEFPAGGWGFRWMGDPDRGSGPPQPGGWVYQIAPYIEQGNVAIYGRGQTGQAKYDALAKQRATVVSIFICPSRRSAVGLPAGELTYNSATPEFDAKTDYAMSSGTKVHQFGGGPNPNVTLTDCQGGFPNCQPQWAMDPVGDGWNGIVGQRLGVQGRRILDGTSNTIMAGEKYLPPIFYEFSRDPNENPQPQNWGDENPGDNSSMWQGYDQDTVRAASEDRPPLPDTTPQAAVYRYAFPGAEHCYGGPHTSAVNMIYADGSVHATEFEIDPQVWDELGNRQNGG